MTPAMRKKDDKTRKCDAASMSNIDTEYKSEANLPLKTREATNFTSS